MYSHIRGILCEANPLEVVIEAFGIGYKLSIPINVIGYLPALGSEIKLFTAFVIREHLQALYGFLDINQRDLFEALLAISGVGPKTALSLVGHLSVAEFKKVIFSSDISSLSKVPGIGKKTAERLILELKDKIQLFHESTSTHEVTVHPIVNIVSCNARDAISALINLGYNQSVAQKAIAKAAESLSKDADVSSLITMALRNV